MKHNSTKQEPEALRLDQFLKVSGIANTGGHAKLMIQSGEVKLNGQIETRRGRKLVAGDCIEVKGQLLKVEAPSSGV